MVFVVYARIYAKALLDALGVIGKNLWTLILPMGLVLVWTLVRTLTGGLGFAGGFVMGFLHAALASVYSYFLAQMVARQAVTVRELRTSLGAYFFNWISFFFLLFMIELGLDIATKSNPDGRPLLVVVKLLELVALNAAPETIYLKGTGNGIETISRSFRFLQENWIEWFVPNLLVIGFVFLLLTGRLSLSWLPLPSVLVPILGGALLHVVAVFRGFLYETLDGSTHRQRMFRFRGSL